jgi:hypothetical protein
MTPEEYGDSLLKEAREINFQYEILVNDVTWINEKIEALYFKVLSDPFTKREENMKELDFLMQKFRINLEAREKAKARSREVGAKVNAFYGKDIWRELP